MIKLIGIMAVLISTSLAGISSSEKLKNRVTELNIINYMLEEISILIRYKALTVYQIIDSLKKNPSFSSLSFISNIEINLHVPFKVSWEKSIDGMTTSLTQSDIKLLKSFGASLGTSDIEGQLSTIEVFKGNFSKTEKDAISVYEKKSRLYRSLGVLAGAFISIMLI